MRTLINLIKSIFKYFFKENMSNPLQLINTTYYQTIKDDPEDRVQIEVGDSKQPDFKPQMKVMRWDNEVNFSLRAQEEVGAVLIELPDGTIVYEAKDYEVHQYDKPDASEEGGFEFEWVLKTKPATNVLTATIQTKGLDFFYQPPLTPEEIAEGGSRPDNVIGSYVAYHSTRSNHKVGDKNYKCGKAFHIYRPKAIDANGVGVWADLYIDEVQGLLTVTVPQKFLDEAVYPVRVDPTIGYTSIGGTTLSVTTDRIIGSNMNSTTDASGGTVSDVRLYAAMAETAREFRGGIYNTSSALLSPQSSAVTIDSGTPQWWISTFTGPTLSASTTYYPTVLIDSASAPAHIVFYYDTGVSDDSKFQTSSVTYPTWPSPATFTNSARRYSIYATYTASGGGATIQPKIMGRGITPVGFGNIKMIIISALVLLGIGLSIFAVNFGVQEYQQYKLFKKEFEEFKQIPIAEEQAKVIQAIINQTELNRQNTINIINFLNANIKK